MLYRITSTFVISSVADVGSFQRADFQARLASSLGVAPAAIAVVVTAGSIIVEATITITNPDEARTAIRTLTTFATNINVAEIVLGMTLQSVSVPMMTTTFVECPPPALHPLPSPPASPLAPAQSSPPSTVGNSTEVFDGSTSDLSGGGDQGVGMLGLAISVAVVVLILLALLLTVYVIVKRRQEKARKHLRNAAETFVAVVGANASSTSATTESGVQMHTGWMSNNKGDDDEEDDMTRV